MFAVSEIAPGGLPAGQSQTQQQMIASVIAMQRVIAAQAGAESGDASTNGFAGNSDRAKTMRGSDRLKQRETTEPQRPSEELRSTRSAEAQSIVEAQEAARTDQKIVAAFQARHGIADLLSVIRDPEDRMLPRLPG